GAPSTGPGPVPGNWTTTCFEFEFSVTDPISSVGENSRVLIWNGTVTNTDARPCDDGLNFHDFKSNLQIQRRLRPLRRRQTHRYELRYGTDLQDSHLEARR